MCELYKETNWLKLGDMLSQANHADALVEIKNAVIGSNREKGALISHEIVPVILNICIQKHESIDDKLNALIILGSLAKGSVDQVELLVKKYNVIPILIKELSLAENNKKVIESCLSIMQSVYEYPYVPVDDFFTDICRLSFFLGLANEESSMKTQICVTSILVSLCQTNDDQVRLLHAGTINVLARMVLLNNKHVQYSALRCLSQMCYCNRSVTDTVCVTSYHGKSLPDILNSLMSRLLTPEIQLTAARCLTYIYRSGTLLPTDNRILHTTLPTLARLCSDNFELHIRECAAETFSYLIEVDADLQQTAAISNNSLKSLSQLIQNPRSSTKQAALRCFAALGANSEGIRKMIINTNNITDSIFNGLNDGDDEVRLASLRCLHTLSRSVNLLRTTFQDYTVWKPLSYMLSGQTSTEFLKVATSIICNLLLEFSPSKEPMINAGILEKLCHLADHKEECLKANSIWALMNVSFQANQTVKTNIINTLGAKKLFELLMETDSTIVIKTLGLIRNLLSDADHIDAIMAFHSTEMLNSLHMILSSSHSLEIKEQTLCVIGNIAAEAQKENYILNNKNIMIDLSQLLFHADLSLQQGALHAIDNMMQRKDFITKEKYLKLVELNIVKNVKELYRMIGVNKFFWGDYMFRIVDQIINRCNKYCPEHMYVEF